MLTYLALVLPALLLSPPGAPLDADVFDASHLPSLLFDVTVPQDFATVVVTPDMLQIGGGAIESVAPVDPAQVAVGLVIDDSPTMTAQAVTDGKGVAVELVSNVGDGTQISLATPSGILSAPTADRDANIARISGMVAGSPDVIPLPELVLRTARDLAAAPVLDRHLVIVQGTTFPAGPILDELTQLVLAAGIRVHVVAATGLDPGGTVGVSAQSGGITPIAAAPVDEIDAVTQTIVDRYRVTAFVDGGGTHDLTLNVQGQPFSSVLDIVARPPIPTTAPSTTSPAVQVAPPVATPAAPPTTAASGTVPSTTPVTSATTRATAPPTTATASSGMGRAARLLVALGLAALAVGAWAVWVVVRGRRATSQRPAVPPATGNGPAGEADADASGPVVAADPTAPGSAVAAIDAGEDVVPDEASDSTVPYAAEPDAAEVAASLAGPAPVSAQPRAVVTGGIGAAVAGLTRRMRRGRPAASTPGAVEPVEAGAAAAAAAIEADGAVDALPDPAVDVEPPPEVVPDGLVAMPSSDAELATIDPEPKPGPALIEPEPERASGAGVVEATPGDLDEHRQEGPVAAGASSDAALEVEPPPEVVPEGLVAMPSSSDAELATIDPEPEPGPALIEPEPERASGAGAVEATPGDPDEHRQEGPVAAAAVSSVAPAAMADEPRAAADHLVGADPAAAPALADPADGSGGEMASTDDVIRGPISPTDDVIRGPISPAGAIGSAAATEAVRRPRRRALDDRPPRASPRRRRGVRPIDAEVDAEHAVEEAANEVPDGVPQIPPDIAPEEPERRGRRGAPAQPPRRTRRRYDDIPLLDAADDHSGDEPDA